MCWIDCQIQVKMETLTVVKKEEQCDGMKSQVISSRLLNSFTFPKGRYFLQNREIQKDSNCGASTKEKSLKDLQILGTKVGECDEVKNHFKVS